ncbi:epoxide hydrolase 1-like [Anneissia japonica]|uniref:epoxide hydrolase 1-like n=1 Tax=Anneissia japonica TaxID=1529436 RepID=UPI001425A85C|nr:epoxide hydrolase 1-like [Anneissia japonica]
MMFWKLISVIVLVLAVGTTLLLNGAFHESPEAPAYGDGWWGKGEKPTTPPDESISPFKIKFDGSALSDLKSRIRNARFAEGLEDSQFHYGVRPEYMRKVAKYWMNSYNWTKKEKEINKYDHFKTNIEGIDVHFMHIKPNLPPGQKAIPLMMIHGWPGSFYEFMKIAPMMTDPLAHGGPSDDAFELVCPSIPGYTFSEGSHKKGLNALAVARIFDKLMKRLGFNQYYIQGGDWGAYIVTKMALISPTSILGLHTNMAVTRVPFQPLLLAIGSYFPSLILSSKEDQDKVFPAGEHFFDLLLETGYMHIQATKPDTLGHALNDSPIGLAAYILEKFSTWTNRKGSDADDGCIEENWTLDEILTNVMLYWMTNSITTSMRFYKENIAGAYQEPLYEITVPSAIADFPMEFARVPEPWTRKQFTDLVQYTTMPRGGHFAAFEVPQLLAKDIRKFVTAVEARKQ